MYNPPFHSLTHSLTYMPACCEPPTLPLLPPPTHPYSYSFPNIVLPFFAGTLLDTEYLHTATQVLASLTLAGQALFTLGVVGQSVVLRILGRFLFGLGGESLSVAQSQV